MIIRILGALLLTILAAGPSHASVPAEETMMATHVPWAIGGPRIEVDGELVDRAPEWPQESIRAIRLWDTRTAWLHLEPARGSFDWSNLDRHLAQAERHGVQHITLVVWGTPSWAADSAAATDAHWLGPGSASPPKDLADWQLFVRTLAERYRGRIHAYEIGNEPTEPMFWRGTDDQLSAMITSAAVAIRSADPQATVLAPIEASIPAGTVDALAFHWYPLPGTNPKDLQAFVWQIRAQRARAGQENLPLWLTEVNLRPGNRSRGQQLSDIAAVNRAAQRAGLAYLAWYAWTDQLAPEFMDLRQPGALAATLRISNARAADSEFN